LLADVLIGSRSDVVMATDRILACSNDFDRDCRKEFHPSSDSHFTNFTFFASVKFCKALTEAKKVKFVKCESEEGWNSFLQSLSKSFEQARMRDKIHSFVIGKITGADQFRLLSPAHFVLEQIKLICSNTK
jgi:hypothetical protein